MRLFNRNDRKSGLMDAIRCDEPSYLIWKWHPAGARPGEGRENAIRCGSSLRVKDGEVAVFVYPQRDGTMQEYIEGPCDMLIDTANFPILADMIGLAYGGGTPFQAEVYFINLARVVQVKFGVPFFDIYDPKFVDFGVPVAVRGTITFQIKDYKEFVKLNRLSKFSLDAFQQQIRDVVCRYVKDTVANAPAVHNISVIQIETKTAQINDIIEYDLSERLKEDFGVLVSGVDIAAIEIDKGSEGYRQLMAVTRDIAARKIEAETQDYVDRLRIQREENQYAMHKQTQTANIGAFRVEKQAEVGVAGARALGQMGTDGMNSDSSGDSFSMAAMMASMAIGGAVGQNIAGTINNTINDVNQQTIPGTVPPPIPAVAYHVAANGQATGPFDLSALSQMAINGQLTENSLVWKAGMTQWEKAGTIDELKDLFATVPPISVDAK